MEYKRAVTVNKTIVVDNRKYHAIAVLCPDCGRGFHYLECGLMYCPSCNTYFKVGVCKVEIQG